MSVLHIAEFKWKDSVSDADIAAFHEALAELRTQMPMLLTYYHGPDLGLRPGNFDYGVVGEFATFEDVNRYLDHPRHQEFAQTFVVPMVQERRAVQIEKPDL